MKIVLTGASGFLGGEVLAQALADPSIDEVLVLTRRPTGTTHAKLKERILDDFCDYSTVDFAPYDACIWALGVSQTSVKKDAYIRITYDFPIAAARAMLAARPDIRFCFVSGRSADPDERSKQLFARIKGRAERALNELSPNVHSFRPGYIRPTKKSGPRKDIARYFSPIGTLIGLWNSNLIIDCDHLAACLLDVAAHGTNEHVLENQALKAWAFEARRSRSV